MTIKQLLCLFTKLSETKVFKRIVFKGIDITMVYSFKIENSRNFKALLEALGALVNKTGIISTIFQNFRENSFLVQHELYGLEPVLLKLKPIEFIQSYLSHRIIDSCPRILK